MNMISRNLLQLIKLLFIIGFIFISSLASGQAIEEGYVEISGSKGFANNVKILQNGNISKVKIVEGLFKVRGTDRLKREPVYFKSYFKIDNNASGSTQGTRKNIDLFRDDMDIYLNIHQQFIIDILELETNKLIFRYEVTRPEIVPQLIRLNSENERDIIKASKKYTLIKLRANEQIALSSTNDEKFQDLLIEYTLDNLKTKKRIFRTGINAFSKLELEPGQEYQLTYNYHLQTESLQNLYIQVEPLWYKSAIAYFTIIALTIISLLLIIAYGLKRKVKYAKRKQQETEEAAIRLQSLLNPHFTFNALSTIQGLMNTDRINEANLYLQEFSSLLRNTLSRSQNLYTNLDQELEMIQTYIKLEALRFNFYWTVTIDSRLNTSVIEIPTLLMQPLVENAIKHGLANLGDKGNLNIICEMEDKEDTFSIRIQDNGIWENEGTEKGYGISLTESRIATINTMNKDQLITLCFNKYKGTEVVLTFKNWIN